MVSLLSVDSGVSHNRDEGLEEGWACVKRRKQILDLFEQLRCTETDGEVFSVPEGGNGAKLAVKIGEELPVTRGFCGSGDGTK